MMSFPKGGLKGSSSDVVKYVEAKADGKGHGYYSSGAAPSQWGGELARSWGLSGPVDARTFKDLLDGLAPDGERFAEAGPDRRMGKDLTFNAPKSVSLAALVGGDKAVLEAHDRATQRAMRWVQETYVTARYKKAGAVVERTGQAVWATYRHEDARTTGGHADPHLHSHTILLNVTQGRDGKLRALDLDFGVDGVHLAGAIYQAELAKELKAAGYSLRRTEDGFELAGVTDAQIADFSARSAQIEAELARQGLDRASATATQKVAANMATREGKTQLSQDELRWEWRTRAREAGLDLDALKGPVASADHALDPDERETVTAADALKHATDHLSERESVINGQSTRLHALRSGVLDGITIDSLESEIAQAHATGSLIDAGSGRLVTRETLTREAMILDTIRSAPPIAPLATPDAALARIAAREASQGFAFLPGQRNAISESICASVQYSGIVGAAGAGKTTAIAAIIDEAHAQGLAVVGLGPSQTAADGLKDAGADEIRTLASFVLRDRDPEAGPRLIVLDEAGMVSARDMQSFLEKVSPEDRVLLVGDPRQLAAVEAGSPFAQAMSEGALQYSIIDEITRQKDAGLLAVAEAFAAGDAERAVDLAEPYMKSVTVTDEDWEVAGADKVEAEAMKDGDATPAMRGLVKSLIKKNPDLPKPLAKDFKTIREWLDQHSTINLGYEAKLKDIKIPPAVRAQAIARETASAYLALSQSERDRTLVMSGTHDIRRAINSYIRTGLQESGAVSDDSVTVTALDKSQLTRAQRREAINYKEGQILRIPEGRGAASRTVDWKITATDPTRNTLTVRDAEGREQTLKARDLDPQKVGLYTARDLELAQGDRVLFTENNRTSGFQNNETGRIVSANAESIEIEKDNGEHVTLDPTQTQTLDHGWAITVHRSQGRTIDRALVAGMASKVATAQSAYVACSRERWNLQIITDNIGKLKTSWARVAERETAHDATRAAANAAAAAEVAQLEAARAEVRAEVQEQAQRAPEPEQQPEPEPEPTPPPPREKERERELGDSFGFGL